MAISLKEQINSFLKLLSEPKILKALLSQSHSGYLLDIGWFNSFKTKTPIDRFGNPIPWLSYPCIDFLSERINHNMNLFEYGSGNSTLYYASRVKKVVSVEHDSNWFEKLKSNLPGNVEIILAKNGANNDYSKISLSIGHKFDIIIVDGIDRNNCIKYTLEALSPNGVIILDDSERKEYKEGIDLVLKNDFKKIDFWGLAPGILFKKCTTVFYKNNNCLEI